MAVHEIRLQGDPLLREKSKRIKNFQDPGLRELAQDLLDTMHAAHGLGLAAPQVGVLLRICVVEMPEDEEGEDPHAGERYILCNPVILKAEGKVEGMEGCLSFPGYVAEIERSERVVVRAQDLSGRTFRVRASGLLSRALQHEIDHLDGVLFVDRLESLDKLHRVEDEAEAEPAAPSLLG